MKIMKQTNQTNGKDVNQTRFIDAANNIFSKGESITYLNNSYTFVILKMGEAELETLLQKMKEVYANEKGQKVYISSKKICVVSTTYPDNGALVGIATLAEKELKENFRIEKLIFAPKRIHVLLNMFFGERHENVVKRSFNLDEVVLYDQSTETLKFIQKQKS